MRTSMRTSIQQSPAISWERGGDRCGVVGGDARYAWFEKFDVESRHAGAIHRYAYILDRRRLLGREDRRSRERQEHICRNAIITSCATGVEDDCWISDKERSSGSPKPCSFKVVHAQDGRLTLFPERDSLC